MGGGVPLPTRGCPLPTGGGVCAPSPENFGTFSLEMARFCANSVVYFNSNVRLFTARTTKLLYIAGG